MGIVEIDYDNDGDFDLYFSRGKEFEKGETFYNAQSKTFGFFTKRGPFQFADLPIGDIIEVENYQSQWPVNDAIFIGESAYQYKLEGETHSGKNMRIINSNGLGFPDNANKKGIHIGFVGNESWRIAGNTWSPATGVVHGVRSYPIQEHQKGLNDLLFENKKGKFTDVTKTTNLLAAIHTAGVATADLDNNGYPDLIVLKRGNLVDPNETILYLN